MIRMVAPRLTYLVTSKLVSYVDGAARPLRPGQRSGFAAGDATSDARPLRHESGVEPEGHADCLEAADETRRTWRACLLTFRDSGEQEPHGLGCHVATAELIDCRVCLIESAGNVRTARPV
jgi:hypothetical protein